MIRPGRLLRWLVADYRRRTTEDPQAVIAERRREARRNRFFHTADGVSYWAGINAVSYNTVVPLFVSKLTDSPLLIGLVAVFSQAGWYLPQLLTAAATERVAYKKPIVVRLGFVVERAPAILWPVAALLSAARSDLGLALFLLAFGLHFVGAGIIAPAWQDLIAHTFAPEERGRFFGLTTFLGTSLGAVGGLGASRVLGVFMFPVDFALAFAFAAVCVQVSWAFLALAKEPSRLARSSAASAGAEPGADSGRDSRPIERCDGSHGTDVDGVAADAARGRPIARRASLGRNGLRGAMGAVKDDPAFARFLVVRTLMGLGTMGFGFVAVHTTRAFAVPDATVAIFTVVMLVGEAAGNISSGTVADRFGHRLPLMLGVAAVTAAFVIARFAGAVGWFFPAFVLMGFAVGAGRVSAMMIAIEFAPDDRVPTYVGITNTLAGVGGLVAPLIGSALAAGSYLLLFLVTAFINLLALVGLITLVKDPRRGRPCH